MVIDPRRKRFVMNMQLRQGFARAKPIRLKISQKKPDFSGIFFPKKARISKSGFKKSKLAKSTQENFKFFVMYRSQENLVFLFPCWNIMKCLNACMLKTAVFELVQQFCHATEFGT